MSSIICFRVSGPVGRQSLSESFAENPEERFARVHVYGIIIAGLVCFLLKNAYRDFRLKFTMPAH